MKFQIVIIMLLLLSLVVAVILYIFSFIMSYKVKNMNKMTPFESGFSQSTSVHSAFSVHFFIILLMFIIFDLEIVLLLGCLLSMNIGVFLLFVLFIVGGIYLEWYLGKLKWLV